MTTKNGNAQTFDTKQQQQTPITPGFGKTRKERRALPSHQRHDKAQSQRPEPKTERVNTITIRHNSRQSTKVIQKSLGECTSIVVLMTLACPSFPNLANKHADDHHIIIVPCLQRRHRCCCDCRVFLVLFFSVVLTAVRIAADRRRAETVEKRKKKKQEPSTRTTTDTPKKTHTHTHTHTHTRTTVRDPAQRTRQNHASSLLLFPCQRQRGGGTLRLCGSMSFFDLSPKIGPRMLIPPAPAGGFDKPGPTSRTRQLQRDTTDTPRFRSTSSQD